MSGHHRWSEIKRKKMCAFINYKITHLTGSNHICSLEECTNPAIVGIARLNEQTTYFCEVHYDEFRLFAKTMKTVDIRGKD